MRSAAPDAAACLRYRFALPRHLVSLQVMLGATFGDLDHDVAAAAARGERPAELTP
jgi:hypothetical protein